MQGEMFMSPNSKGNAVHTKKNETMYTYVATVRQIYTISYTIFS
jgi:hypothetical protein